MVDAVTFGLKITCDEGLQVDKASFWGVTTQNGQETLK